MLTRQVLLAPQVGQVPPPQSASVSLPFLTLSVQLGPAQLPLSQIPLRQSLLALQAFPVKHWLQPGPPQSTSDSLPFLTRSVHPAAEQVLVEVEQTRLTQSDPLAQVLPLGQGLQVPPPQSTSLSVQFLTPSLQEGVEQRPALQ